jgi:hypothetical protein
MDKFKAELTKQCAVGGLKCSCCNPKRETSKTSKRNRIKTAMAKKARKKLKEDLVSSKRDEDINKE